MKKMKIAALVSLMVMSAVLLSSCVHKRDEPAPSQTESSTDDGLWDIFEPSEQESTDTFQSNTTTVNVEKSTASEQTTSKAHTTQKTPSESKTESETTTTEKTTSKETEAQSSGWDFKEWVESLNTLAPKEYYKKVKTGTELEAKYMARGSYNTAVAEYKTDNKTVGTIAVWYPADVKSQKTAYPLVIMANGSGVTYERYKPVFERLASWGFIVAGNMDESSWSGESSEYTLNYMLNLNKTKSNIFYGKIDTANIGIAGHSQGGVGAINAASAQPGKDMYKAVFAISTTHLPLAQFLKWDYNISAVKAPIFQAAGTGDSDAGDGKDNAGIAPLWSMTDNFNAVKNVPKIIARRKNAQHGDMLYSADGYMTAWFCYWLKGDTAAFKNGAADIAKNPYWQDVKAENF